MSQYEYNMNQAAPQPYRNLRGGSRKGGCLSKLNKIPLGAKLTVVGLFIGTMASIIFVLWWFWPRPASVTAQTTPKIKTIPAPYTATLIPNPTLPPPPTVDPSFAVIDQAAHDLQQMDETDINATATMLAAISRPAQGIGDNNRQIIGSIDLRPQFGFCAYSTIGFNASGQPFFLYFPVHIQITQDHLDRKVMIRGLVQDKSNCQYQLLLVESINILNEPAEISQIMYTGGKITGTTGLTTTIPSTPWGLATSTTGLPRFGTPPAGYSAPTPTTTLTATTLITDTSLSANYVPPQRGTYPTYTP